MGEVLALELRTDLERTVHELTRHGTRYLCEEVFAPSAAARYFEPGYTAFSGMLAVCGRIAYPLAHDTAIAFVCDLAAPAGLTCEIDADVETSRREWRRRLAENSAKAARLAVADLAEMRDRIERFSGQPPGADQSYILSHFDTCKFFGIGADSEWPELHVGPEVESALDVVRSTWLSQYPEIVARGGLEEISNEGERRVYWQLSLATLEQDEIPWLPSSFWWRRLAALVKPLLS